MARAVTLRSRSRSTLPSLTVLLVLATVLLAGPLPVTAEADVPHLFVFTRTDGFRHSSIPHANAVIAELAETTGAFTAEFSEDTAAVTPELLARTDAILFANTTGEHPFSDEQKGMIVDWLLDGGGFMGIHAAADTNYTWPEYQELVGAAFESHPHNGNQMGGFLLDRARVQVEAPDHPILAPYQGAESFELREEYYRWRANPRGTQDVEVLLSLDETSTYTGPGRTGLLFPAYDDDQPLEWTKSFRGANRVWYTNLGHYNGTYDDPAWQAHFVAAVEWVTSADEPAGPPPPAPPPPPPAGPDLSAVAPPVVAPPSGQATGFVAPQVAVVQGMGLSLLNTDTTPHDIVSLARDADRRPLFKSEQAGFGELAPVVGVADLAPAEYDFFCSMHPGMAGTLTVLPASGR